MKIQQYIENVLQPKIQGDGGWIEFVSLDGDELTVIFRGECSKCLILNRCVALKSKSSSIAKKVLRSMQFAKNRIFRMFKEKQNGTY